MRVRIEVEADTIDGLQNALRRAVCLMGERYAREAAERRWREEGSLTATEARHRFRLRFHVRPAAPQATRSPRSNSRPSGRSSSAPASISMLP